MYFIKGRRLFSFFWSILLAAIPTIIIFSVIPLHRSRFNLECTETHKIPDDRYNYYEDLNGDGNSEKISAFDSPNSSGVTIYENNRVIDQWNIRGSFAFIQKEVLFIAMDYDGDRKKEVYLFSVSNDSILLHIIRNIYNSSISLKNRFISKVGPGRKAPDPSVIKGAADDLDGDGEKELIFGINTGFSKFPRQVFAYYVRKDSLAVSPSSSAFISGLLQADINDDGKNEIIPYGYASGNISPDAARYHDYSAWLMALDQNLRFLFAPIEFKGRYIGIKPLVNRRTGSVLDILTWPQDKDSLSSIYGVNSSGRIMYRESLGMDANDIISTKSDEELLYLIYSGSAGLCLFDKERKLLRNEKRSGYLKQADVDSDGSTEIIFTSCEDTKVQIYREGFRDPAACEISWEPGSEERITVIQKEGRTELISFQAGNKEFLLKYGHNSYYYLNYGVYAAVYLSFLGFVVFVQLMQKRRSENKFAIEKKITDLQLSLVRNQLDPHFTLNAINSVIFSVQNSEKERAVSILRKFSSLYRTIVLSAGQSRRSLRDEIFFCTEYLNFEKMRLGDKFDYDIILSDEINDKVLVPKMLIHFFAENAMKHAFKKSESAGKLNIKIAKTEKGISITIEDNGIGRKKAGELNQDSTQKGFEIISELFSLYNRYYQEKINLETADLFNTDGEASGTRVIISIN